MNRTYEKPKIRICKYKIKCIINISDNPNILKQYGTDEGSFDFDYTKGQLNK